MWLRRIAAVVLLLASPSVWAEDDAFVKRLTSLDPKAHADVLVEWTQALQKATDEDIDAAAVLLFLPKLDPLYDKSHKFQPAVSKQFVERIKNLPQDRLSKWQDATDALGAGTTMTDTVILLIQTERIFHGSKVKLDELTKLTARQAALTEDNYADWIEATELEEGQALLSLVLNDGLFDTRNALRQDAFKKALESARRAREKQSQPAIE
jgi:hypothetical protein